MSNLFEQFRTAAVDSDISPSPPEMEEPLPAGTSSGPGEQETTVLKNVAASTPLVNEVAADRLCPTALRELQGWLIWKLEPNPGGGRDRKVPYWAAGGRRAGKQGSPDDRAQLVDFETARTAAQSRGFAGVGFALMPDFQIVALDFDHCIDDAGNVHPEVAAVCGSSYAEVSPSGKGVRAFFRGALGDLKDHAKSGDPAKTFGMEIFSTKGFVTVTHNVLPLVEIAGNEDTIAPLDAPVLELAQRRFRRTVDSVEATNYGAAPVGLTPDQIDRCLEALPNDLDYDAWLSVGLALHHETQGEGFEIFDAWSQLSPKYSSRQYGLERWNSFGKSSDGNTVTARSLVRLANQHGADVAISAMAPADDFEVITPEAAATASAAINKAKRNPKALDWTALPENPTELPFIIPGWMPDGVVTLFAAHGGTGKSFLSLYIGLCLALGRHPFDRSRSIDRVKVVLYSAEDSMLVMQSRIARYLRILGAEPTELAGWLHILDATECDNVLFTGDEKVNGRTTWRFDWLAREITAFDGQVLIFDNASDAIDANENDRAKVRQFMSALKRLASAVLLLAHVDAVSSMADLADAKGYSGSTAWHNSARSRWFMARVKDSEDVVLTLPKVNYAKAGGEVVIRWSDPHKVFDVVTMRQGRAKAADHRDALLRLLRDAVDGGAVVSPASNTATSVLNTIKDMPGCPHGLKPADVAKEVLRWRSDDLVLVETYKRENRTTGQRIVLTDAGRRACEGGADAPDFE